MRSRRLIPCLLTIASLVAAATVVVASNPATASLAWDDDPCEEYGGQVAVAPDVAVAPAVDHPRAYVACGDGSLLYHGVDGKGSNVKIPGIHADDFVDVASTTDDSMYAVTSHGKLTAMGNYAVHRGDLSPTSGVVALEMSPSGRGYWIVTNQGRVVGFGDAPDLGPSEPTTVHSPIVAFASYGSSGGWLVTALGEVVAVGNAPDHGSVTGPVADSDRVVGIVTDRRTGGFWVVTRDGDIIEAGGAPAEPDMPKCLTKPGASRPFSGAVGDPNPNAPAPLWVYAVAGGICGFHPGK
jgi:hypothetical protein